MNQDHSALVRRWWYSAPIADFLTAPCEAVLGELVANCDFDVTPSQRDAWVAQIELLRDALHGVRGWVFFEFSIPRMGRRIDVVVVADGVILVIEFKVGGRTFDRSAVDQVWDYALDLKNFHAGSHDAALVPILVATEANKSVAMTLQADVDGVFRPLLVNGRGLREPIDVALRRITCRPIDGAAWARTAYHPTPTIVEAARALYAQHSVEAIARFDAGAQNLHTTSGRIKELVDEARTRRRKTIMPAF